MKSAASRRLRLDGSGVGVEGSARRGKSWKGCVRRRKSSGGGGGVTHKKIKKKSRFQYFRFSLFFPPIFFIA